MTKVYVSYTSEVTHSKRAKKQHGDWSQTSEYEVTGVSLVKDPYNYCYVECEVPADLQVGDQVHVVWITYSSGDSFGTSRGNGSIIAVFKDPYLAYKAKDNLLKNEKEYTLYLTREDYTTKEPVQNPVAGYFEHLTNVNVQTFLLSI